jgi:hypothetical protein
MNHYLQFAERDAAFDWIEKQDWDNKKKCRARYTWKKRHAPDTIRSRKQMIPECPICFEEGVEPPKHQTDKCQHYTTICKKCHANLYKCPICRQQWRVQEQQQDDDRLERIVMFFVDIYDIIQILRQLRQENIP